MATMQALIEKDKERFLHNMAAARSSAESVRAVEEQLGRMLTAYNEEEENERIKNMAVHLIGSLSSAAGLLDCDGESVIWSRSQYRPGVSRPKRSAWFFVFFFLGLLCLVAAGGALIYFTDTLPPGDEMIIGLSVMAAGALFLFLSGIFSARKKEENKEELYAETIPDGEKTYHILLNMALTMDRILEQVRDEELLQDRKALQEEKEGLKKEDIQFLSGLLEAAYGESDSEYGKQIISDVKFYLHQKKIDVVDYDGGNRDLFELMPSDHSGTIRPALMMAGMLVRKGLATGE